MASPVSQKSPAQPSVWHFDGGGLGFHFTIRRADAVDTGLDLVANTGTGELIVQTISEDCAGGAWKRLCTGPRSVKWVMPRDRIVSVNQLTGDCQKMLMECKNKQLLKFVVIRGEADIREELASQGMWSHQGDEGEDLVVELRTTNVK